jgi:acylphosphatase
VAGYARNLADGRVEVLAIGDAAQVDLLVQWLWQGPPTARVTAVVIAEVELTEVGPFPQAFTIA